MREQIEKVVYLTDDFSTEPTAKLSLKLAEFSPRSINKRIWFAQSGAAAAEGAIKGARLYKLIMKGGSMPGTENHSYPYPYKIILRYRSWHGATTAAVSVSGDPRRWFQKPFVMPGVVFGPDSYCSHWA